MLRPILVSSLIVMTASAWAAPVRLTGEIIRQELIGSLLKIDTPLGVVIPVRVSGDGLMSGEAGPLASTLGAAQDRGRWWIDHDRLCVKWFRWFEAQTRCLTLDRDGTKIYWRDAEGRTGTATVTKSGPEPATVNSALLKEAEQRSTPSSVPPPLSEVPVATVPTLDQFNKHVEPLRFAAVDLSASASRTPSEEAGISKLGVGTSNPPANVPLSKAVGDRQTPLPNRKARKSITPISRGVPYFRVARVAVDDALVVRSGPSEYHAAIGAIPSNGEGVQIVGTCYELWCPVRHNRTTGWVNRYYLADENIWRADVGGEPARAEQ